MGVLRDQKTCLKSATFLFTRQSEIGPETGFSNEIICILAARGTVKLQEVKFKGSKKFWAHHLSPIYEEKRGCKVARPVIFSYILI